jgi:hypothetical protein
VIRRVVSCILGESLQCLGYRSLNAIHIRYKLSECDFELWPSYSSSTHRMRMKHISSFRVNQTSVHFRQDNVAQRDNSRSLMSIQSPQAVNKLVGKSARYTYVTVPWTLNTTIHSTNSLVKLNCQHLIRSVISALWQVRLRRIKDCCSPVEHLEEILLTIPHEDWVRLYLDARMLTRIQSSLRRHKTTVYVLYVLSVLNWACSLVKVDQSITFSVILTNVISNKIDLLLLGHFTTINSTTLVLTLYMFHNLDTDFRCCNNVCTWQHVKLRIQQYKVILEVSNGSVNASLSVSHVELLFLPTPVRSNQSFIVVYKEHGRQVLDSHIVSHSSRFRYTVGIFVLTYLCRKLNRT